MKIELTNGQLFINDKEVLTTVFTDGETMGFPIQSNGQIVIDDSESTTTDILGDSKNSSLPTEKQVLQTIFDCVFIRGVDLEDYKYNFSNEQSGLYNALVKLFKANDANVSTKIDVTGESNYDLVGAVMDIKEDFNIGYY